MNVRTGRILASLTLAPFVAGPLLLADEALLTLEEAVAIAMASSDRLVLADARVAAAAARDDGARAPRLPRLDLLETVSVTTNPATVFANLLGQEAFTVDDFDPGRLNNPDPLSNFNTTLAVSQSLWTGGSQKRDREAASLSLEARRHDREAERQAVIRDVTDAYGAAVLAERQLEVAESALDGAVADARLIADLNAAGLALRSDLLAARVHESEMFELLARAEGAVDVSRAALNLTLGRDPGIPFELPADLGVAAEPADTLDALIESARTRRPDLRAARLDAEAAAERAQGAGDRYDVGVRGMLEANAEDFIGAEGTNWSVFLTARVRLFDGHGSRSAKREGAALAAEARAAATLLERTVELDVRRAWAGLRSARLRLEQSAAAMEMSGAVLDLVRDRYGEGLATWVELLDARTALTRARVRDVHARYDGLLARTDLDLSAGRL